jgi:hypothetical protein
LQIEEGVFNQMIGESQLHTVFLEATSPKPVRQMPV